MRHHPPRKSAPSADHLRAARFLAFAIAIAFLGWRCGLGLALLTQ